MLKLITVLLLITTFESTRAASDHVAGPSKSLLIKAYCACQCCKTDTEECYKHPVIGDISCDNETCEDDNFCPRWRMQQCKTSCYCDKCRGKIPDYEKYRCVLHTEVQEDCKCEQFWKEIRCSEMVGDNTEEKKVKQEMEKLEGTASCVVPCYCSKCYDNLPSELKQGCKKHGKKSAKDCDCSSTECPTQDMLNKAIGMVAQIKEKVKNMNRTKLKEDAKSDKSQADAINAQLKITLGDDKAPEITSQQIRQSKCKLQCICDFCQDESPELAGKCAKLLPERMEFCPECDANIECPNIEEGICKAVCFCRECATNVDMTEEMRIHCKSVTKENPHCQCFEEVDCNIIGKLKELGQGIQQMESSGEVHKTPMKGKIKKKTKLWDEL